MSKLPKVGPSGLNDRVLRKPMRVVATHNGWAYLQGERAQACSTCMMRSGCGVSALSQLLKIEPPRLRVSDHGSAEVGDNLIVSFAGGAFLKTSFVAYLLPPAGLVLAALLAGLLGLGDTATAALCVPVFLLSLLPLWLVDRSGRTLDALQIEPLSPTANRSAHMPQTTDQPARHKED